MLFKSTLSTALVFDFALSCMAQDKPKAKPIELEVLKAYIGVWDAEIEVWPAGPESPSTKFKGVERNRPYGEYWIASDFDSEFMGQTMKVHSIVGYDLDQEKMVGTVIDHGPYAASMTGDYDVKSKTVRWITEAKDPNGKPMLQKTLITQKNANERVLVLSVPGKQKDDFTKFMQIRFVKQNLTAQCRWSNTAPDILDLPPGDTRFAGSEAPHS
jgi:hypothetical protein